MATCRDCGAEVHWGRVRGSSSIHPPLVYTGAAMTISRGEVVQVPTYARHVCDPDEKQAWVDHLTDREQSLVEYVQDRDAAWEYALRRECSKCGAPVNERCHNLSERARGREVETVWPHPARVVGLTDVDPD